MRSTPAQSGDDRPQDRWKLTRVDAAKGMREIQDGSASVVLTDPPYGTTNYAWDRPIDCAWLLQESFRVLRPRGALVVFCAGKFTAELLAAGQKCFRYKWVWWKVGRAVGFLDARRRPLRAHEDILVFCRDGMPLYNPIKVASERPRAAPVTRTAPCGLYARHDKPNTWVDDGTRYQGDVLSVARDPRSSRLHPTQKPVHLLRMLVGAYSNSGDLVVDPFAGSGSTGEAALRCGRRFVGFELEPSYHRRASERLAGVAREIPCC